jgi:hypothetical protein
LAPVPARRPPGLDELLDDVVLYSPIVHTPQLGNEITKIYLRAAAATLPGDEPTHGGDPTSGGFRYTKQVVAADTAVRARHNDAVRQVLDASVGRRDRGAAVEPARTDSAIGIARR